MYPLKVTIWWRLWAGGIIGLYIFEDEFGYTVPINGERHHHMKFHFLWPELNYINHENLWFQPDVSTSLIAHETKKLFHEKIPSTLISQVGTII